MSKYSHKEAFCLMLYRDEAGNEEWIWNSRDGVTPFMVTSRQGLRAQHVEWHRDRCVPDHKPKPGDRIFVDLTLDRAREFRTKYVERWWDEMGMSREFASKAAAIDVLAAVDLEHGGGGAPDLIAFVEAAS